MDVEDDIKACVKCQMNKHSTQLKINILQPIPFPTTPSESLSMDVMTRFSMSGRWNAIMVIVCRYSKWATFLPTTKNVIAKEVA